MRHRRFPLHSKQQTLTYKKMKTIGFVLMMDASGSMFDAMTQVKINTKAFIDKMTTNDQFGVNCFNNYAYWVYPTGTSPVIATITGYDKDTPEKKAARDAIERMQASGLTNIGDAISKGYPLLQQANTDKKVFILLSDGAHNEGTHPKDVLTSQYPIYIAGLGPFLDEKYFAELVNKHSESKYFHRPDVADVEQILNDIRGLAPDTSILTNQKVAYQGSYYQETSSIVSTQTGHAQFTVVWNDKRFRYTNQDAGGFNLKVYLIGPTGKRYTNPPTIVGEGYCIFNLTDARSGRWRTFVEYSVPQLTFATNGAFEFGATTRLDIHAANNIHTDEVLKYGVELTDNGIPLEGLQVQARILQPVISTEKALVKYANQLDQMNFQPSAANDQPSDCITRLQRFRIENLPYGDILGFRQSSSRLDFSKEGLYEGLLTDTKEAGFYTIEITASGKNRLTGQEVRLTKTHTLLVR
ncbi:vWA domain-containing protein [Dysgonomonas sp.]